MKGKREIGLITAVFIGLILGAVTGILLRYVIPAESVRDSVVIDDIFYVMGNDFLHLVQMLVAPLVFCSLVCGSMAMGDTKRLGRIGVKTLGFYLMTIALAIAAVILTANVANPGKRLNMTSIETADAATGERTNLTGTPLATTSTNPLHVLAGGDTLSVILFVLFAGVILAGLGESGEVVGNFSSQFNNVMMQMAVVVIRLAPYGMFCLTIRTFSGIGFDVFMPLLKYMAGVMITLAIQYLMIYMVTLRVFTGLGPGKFLKKFLPVVGFTFSIATSNAIIPMSIDTFHRKVGVAKRVSSFTTPLGATINMGGTAIMQSVVMVPALQTFDIHLAMADYLTVILAATLASIGTAGAPRVGLITLSIMFTSVGLPVEAIALIMGTDRILDMNRTAVNITGDAVCTTIVTSQDGAVGREVFDGPEVGAGIKE